MCRGVEEESRSGGEEYRRSICRSRSVPVTCELCGSRASLYCDADSAFLCRNCDRWVHRANFLARRHVRLLLCIACQKLTRRCLVGEDFQVVLPPAAADLEITTLSERDTNHSDKLPFVFL